MMGNEDSVGIIPKAIQHVFKIICEVSNSIKLKWLKGLVFFLIVTEKFILVSRSLWRKWICIGPYVAVALLALQRWVLKKKENGTLLVRIKLVQNWGGALLNLQIY